MIRETRRAILIAKNYKGVCCQCNNELEYLDEEFATIIIEHNEDGYIVVPIDIFYCPNCYRTIESMFVSKDVHLEEILSKKKEEK